MTFQTLPARRCLALLSVLIATGALAPSAGAQKIAVPPPDRWVRPQLIVPADGQTPVRLQQVSVRAQISGSLAVTEVTMVFHNPNRQVLEGELQFPLLDGQNILGFALDINGRLRDAVPVEKARGQAVFEDIIRGQIDPALLEVTQGNNFKLRVYPIPPQGTRQVLLRYAETLRSRNGRYVYRLPLEFAETLDAFRLDVGVSGVSGAPTVTRGRLDGLTFERTGSRYRAQVSRERFAGRGLLEIDLTPVPGPQATTQLYEGKTYFHAEVPVPVREAARVVPAVVGLVWDSSGSGAARDHAREFALLDAYFRRQRNGEVRLTRVRDTAEPVQVFRIANGDWRALRAALEATPYDGATNLGAMTIDPAVREYLVFTDGLSNFGERPFPAAGVPVFTISSATRADPTLLRHLAEATGGRFVDLVAGTPAAAAHVLLTATTRVTAVAGEGATQLVLPSPYPERNRIAIAGQLTGNAARIRLTIVDPGANQPMRTIEVPVRAGEAPFDLVAPLWARYRIAALEAQYHLNRAEIRRLGQAFKLPTRETSLIVLDRVQDYARYEIVPPPELLADYQRLRQVAVRARGDDRNRHLEQVVARFNEKMAWWNRDFPKGDKPAPQAALAPMRERARDQARPDALRPQEQAENRRAESAPAAPPPPAAKPAPSQSREMDQSKLAANAASGTLAGAAAAAAETTASIRLKRWEPDAPYMARFRNASKGDLYRVYLDERAGYLASTAFFLDAADVFFDKGEPELAVRALSNLAEMDLENRHILRVLGHRLLQANRPQLAALMFRRVLELSPEEPQSYRDLGLALAADRQFQKAIDLLNEVVTRPWHGRFPEVELIALAELNAIVATAGEPLDVSRIDPRLLTNLPLDLRVVLTWDADNTDIDLWVTDPNGEKAFYGNRLTFQGSRMSLDFTGGYGPEEFSLKQAKPGKYKVEAQYFGDRRQAVTGPTTLQMKLTTKFGLAAQQDQTVTLRLKAQRETVFVGEFEVK